MSDATRGKVGVNTGLSSPSNPRVYPLARALLAVVGQTCALPTNSVCDRVHEHAVRGTPMCRGTTNWRLRYVADYRGKRVTQEGQTRVWSFLSLRREPRYIDDAPRAGFPSSFPIFRRYANHRFYLPTLPVNFSDVTHQASFRVS